MPKLFVSKSIEINASANKIWEVLTKRQYSDKYSTEFSDGDSGLYIDTTWQLGSPVLWKDQSDILKVKGQVTAIQPNSLLRFSVADVASPEVSLSSDKDGISYRLIESGGKTKLSVSQGDFSVIPESQKYYEATLAIWDRVLPKIKKLAESPD